MQQRLAEDQLIFRKNGFYASNGGKVACAPAWGMVEVVADGARRERPDWYPLPGLTLGAITRSPGAAITWPRDSRFSKAPSGFHSGVSVGRTGRNTQQTFSGDRARRKHRAAEHPVGPALAGGPSGQFLYLAFRRRRRCFRRKCGVRKELTVLRLFKSRLKAHHQCQIKRE